MIELTGVSLAERQKELNKKINDAAKNKNNFDKIKSQVEESDIDKLYKIGIASKHKNVEYIIDIFKSGDSLYISKALKCIWLYDNEYAHIINSEYLNENIFSFMSHKMIKKFLTTISIYMSDKRAIDFYTYCIKMKFTNIAIKFLIFTPVEFKLEILKDKNTLCTLRNSNVLLTRFLGNSCELAEAYYNTVAKCDRANALYQLRHFYFISAVRYLEICKMNDDLTDFINPIGLRISKDIMKKHKDVIYEKPMIYLFLVNKTMLVQYSTVDDAKFYIKTLISLYPKPNDFWKEKFCDKYYYIIEKIPLQERLQFIKNTFNNQYPGEEFETSKQFYNDGLFKLMTPGQREIWALKNMENGLELFGSGKEFMWYKFVSFDKAFEAIKKYIQTVVNIDDRREALTVLVESAETESKLEILLYYYNKRYLKEQQHNKQHFINDILLKHNVYDFSTSCWDVFNKLLFNVCNNLDCQKKGINNCYQCTLSKSVYKYVDLIYHVIHRTEVPETLIKFLDTGIDFYTFKPETDKLSKDKAEVVYQYLLKYYLDKLKAFDNKTYNDEEKDEIGKYINSILYLMRNYDKKLDGSLPEIVIKYMKLDIDSHREYFDEMLTQKHLIHFLKKDKQLLVSKLPLIKDRILQNNSSFKLNTLLKILRTYFYNDLATEFLEFFKGILVITNPCLETMKIVVYGIMELADTDFKKDFMSKYVPIEPKINHSKIDPSILCIQKSICSMACYSRPPVPLSNMTKFIKGDYVHFCLPMFNSYLNKLPKHLCIEFVKSLLDAPLSVQKHGLRMAFQCFAVEDLRKLILQVWEKTKNVSLRSIIYASVRNKIVNEDEHTQNELFEDFKLLTTSLREDDDEEVFTLIFSHGFPQRFIGKHLEAAWSMVNTLPEKSKFIIYRSKVIKHMEWNIHSINKEVIEPIIYNHVNHMLNQEKIILKYQKQEEELVESKWSLLQKYVTFFTDDDDCRKKADLIMLVIKECLKLWIKVDNHEYKLILKKFILKFVRHPIYYVCYNLQEMSNYAKYNIIFEQILKELQDTLPKEEIYEIVWEIRICILCRKIIIDGREKLKHNTNPKIIIKESLMTYAKEFASLFIESIESRKCYVSFFDKIQEALKFHLEELLRAFDVKDDQEIGKENTHFIICLDILKYNSFETYMFCLKLLPNNINDYIDRRGDYVKVINTLKSCEYDELKSYMYKKFVTTDYIYRDYMLSQGDV